MKEFGGFAKGTQRYIRRSLDVGLDRRDAVKRWSRDPAEAAGIRAQERIYRRLEHIRSYVPDDSGLDAMEPLMAPLITMTAFDLGQDRLPCFASYRFLYERLIGANVRPWLPARFLRGRGVAAPSSGSPPDPAAVDQRSGGDRAGLVEPRAGLLPRMGREGRHDRRRLKCLFYRDFRVVERKC